MEVAHLVSTHLQIVVTQLRVDVHDDPYRQPPPSVLALLRSFGAARRAALSYVPGGSCLPFLEPFLATIRCEETSGLVTQRALSSVLAMLRADVLSHDSETAGRAVSDIVSAATNCRCEVTDTSSDEVVILGILKLLQGVAACEAGALLSDAAVCEIVHACFRICSQPSLSELLRHSAEASLRSIVESVFQRLPVLPADRLMHPGMSELAAAGAAAGDAEEIVHHIRSLDSPPSQGGAGKAEAGIGAPQPGQAGEQTSEESGAQAQAEIGGGAVAAGAAPPGAAAGAAGAKPAGLNDDAPPPPTVSADAADATAGFPSGHRTALTAPAGRGVTDNAPVAGAGANGAGGGGTGGAGGRSEATSGARDDPETGGEGTATGANPYGGACLFEVLGFFVGLIDGSNQTIAKGPAVREFGLSLLLTALRAGGPTLGRAPPFSSLLEDELCLALIQSAEAEAVPPTAAAGRESAALGLTLQCAAEVLLLLGLRGTAREEALLTRIHLKLLCTPGLPPLRLETALEHLQHLVALTELPHHLYLRFDCNPNREDLLDKLASSLRAIAAPARPAPAQTAGAAGGAGGAAGGAPPAGWVGGPAYARARDLALEALLDLITAVSSLADRPTMGAPRAGEAVGAGDADAPDTTELLQSTLQRKAHKRAVQAAAADFSTKPSKGLATLARAGLLPHDPTPAATAAVLRSMAALDKAALGEFLSLPPDPAAKNPDFHKQLLAEWAAKFNFASYRIDQAMRIFLQSFRLPGEAQKIDRIMEAFAHAFYSANPGPLAHPDAAYVLAFSMIMLNTDLHSTKIAAENKMSLASFYRQNEGINGGIDLPQELLATIYNAIKNDEIRMLGGGEEQTLSAAGWAHLGDSDGGATAHTPAPKPNRASPGAAGGWTMGAVGADAPAEQALLHSAGLAAEMLATVCWAPAMAALGAAARAAAARAESESSGRRKEAKKQLETVHAGYALACRHAAAHRLHAQLDALAAHLAKTSTLLLPPPSAPSPAPDRLAAPPFASAGAAADPPPLPRAPYHARLPARLAAAALCRLVREEGYALRDEGWSYFIEALLGLDARGMLPASLLAADGTPDALLLPPPPPRASPPAPSSSKNASFSGWLSSSISALITGGADDDAAAEAAAEAAAAEEVERFGIAEVFRGSAHLPTEALVSLVAALAMAASPTHGGGAAAAPPDGPRDASSPVSRRPAPTGALAEPPTTPAPPPPPPGTPWTAQSTCAMTPEPSTSPGAGPSRAPASAAPGSAAAASAVSSPRRRALALELLLGVVTRNRDRFEVLWPHVAPCVAGVLSTGSAAPVSAIAAASAALPAVATGAAAEHATLALLRMARRLVHRDAAVESVALLLAVLPAGIQADAATAVTPARSAGDPDAAAPPPAASLPKLSPRAARAIGSEMVRLLQAGGGSGLASAEAWLALTRLAAGVAVTDAPKGDDAAPRAGVEALASLLAHSTHAAASGASAPFAQLWALLLLNAHAAPSAGQCEHAVGLLLQLHARLRAAEPTAGADPPGAWRADWLRVLRGMCSLCLDARVRSRDATLVAMQRALLDADLPPLPPSCWLEAFEHAVFPFLSELLRRWVDSPEPEQERLMLRAVTLLSKTFLHHLSGLLTLPSFHLLWLRALELLESFMRAPNSEMLAEAVPETLKNMLLVIGTSGAFEHKAKLGGTQQDLCQLTVSVVGAMCPQLTSSPDLGWLWGAQHDGAQPEHPTPNDTVAAAPDEAANAVPNGEAPLPVG